MKQTGRKVTAWEKKCESVAEAAGTSVYFPDFEVSTRNDCFEDDGALHVHVKGKLWAVFTIGQDTPAKEANEMTRKIMTGLGLEKKISERVLVVRGHRIGS
jgi:hypothetical protein